MTTTRICPTCHKELPALAIRCRYCGFKLSEAANTFGTDSGEDNHGTPKASVHVMGDASKKKISSTMPPTRRPKQTLLGVASTPLSPPLPSAPSLPRPATMPPPPLARPLYRDTTDWIPQFEDASQVVELNADSTSEVDLHEALQVGSGMDVETPGAQIKRIARKGLQQTARFLHTVRGCLFAWKETHGPLVHAWLIQPLFAGAFIHRCRDARVPEPIRAFLDKLRVYHAGITAIILLVGIGVLIASGNDDSSVAEQKLMDAGRVDATIEKQDATGTTNAGKGASGEKALGALSPVKRRCLAFGAYPVFPWSIQLYNGLRTIDAGGICGLFGKSVQIISRAFAEISLTTIAAVDGLPGISQLRLFPKGDKETGDADIVMWFYKENLFRIELLYEDSFEANFDFRQLEELLGVKAQKTRAAKNAKVQTLVDADMTIRFVDEKNARMLSFDDSATSAPLSIALERVQTAKALVATADALIRVGKVEEALTGYKKAAAIAPGFGAPLLGICDVYSRLEKFDRVIESAKLAAKSSADVRVHASAQAYLAMAALWGGDRGDALEKFGRAASMDSTVAEYRMAISELTSGQYETARVAATAARMSCMKKNKSTIKGILIRSNFENTEMYFSALRVAKTSSDFSALEKQYIKAECR